MNTKPKLLFLTHRFPYPPNRGDRIRSFHMLKYLAERFSVFLGALWDESPGVAEMDVIEGLCSSVAACPVGRKGRWVSGAASLVRGRTATEGLFRSAKLRKMVDHWAEIEQFDAVLVFCSSMFQYVDDCRALDRVPVVVDLVDVDSQKWFDYADRANGVLRRLFQLEGGRLRKLECAIHRRSDAVTLVSDAEADLLRSISPGTGIYGIGNGVDLNYFQRHVSSVRHREPSFVFVGALDYRANVEGVKWFVEKCWPLVVAQRPEATLTLVGRNPSTVIRHLATIGGVSLVGEVPDVRPYLRDSAVTIAPLLTARGIQNKVLEAMAMGKPVVATPQAIEGIDCVVGRHVLQATSPNEWKRTLLSLAEDVVAQDRIGSAARGFVEENFSWQARLKPLGRLLGLRSNETECRGKIENCVAVSVLGTRA